MSRRIPLALVLALALLGPLLPWADAQLPTPKVAVSCALEDTIVLVDSLSARVQGKAKVCTDPGGLAASPDGRWLLVGEHSGAGLAVVDPLSLRVIVPVRSEHLRQPRGMVFSPDSARLYLLSEAAQALLEIHVPSWKTIRLMPLQAAGTRDLAMSADGLRLYVGHRDSGVVSVVDLAEWQLRGQHRLAERIGGLDVTADGARVLVALPGTNTVGIYRSDTFARLEEVPVGQGAAEVRISGNRAVVVNAVSNDVSVFDPDRPAGRYRIGVGVGPRDVLVSPDGRWAYVPNYNTNDLSVLDLEKGRQLGRLAVGKGPKAVAWVPVAR